MNISRKNCNSSQPNFTANFYTPHVHIDCDKMSFTGYINEKGYTKVDNVAFLGYTVLSVIGSEGYTRHCLTKTLANAPVVPYSEHLGCVWLSNQVE